MQNDTSKGRLKKPQTASAEYKFLTQPIIKDKTMKTVKTKKNRLRQTATAMLAAAMLAQAMPAHSTGFPVFDGASAINALQQLMNWKTRLEGLARTALSQIPGVKEFIDANQQGEIKALFERRKNKCRKIRENNQVSGTYCLRIVELEETKYQLLSKMDKDMKNDFSAAEKAISKQGSFAKSQGIMGAIEGFASFAFSNSSGKAESSEKEVQIRLQAIESKFRQYEAQLNMLDRTIEQYNNVRKLITKDQLNGSGNLNSTIRKGVAAGWLEKKAIKFNQDAKSKRGATAQDSKFQIF